MAHKIVEIKGMSPEIEAKLAGQHITTTDELVDQTKTPQQRAALAKQLNIPSSDLTELINRADLMRLKGVGREMANLLEECGVDSIKELQHRKADHLHEKLKEANDAKKITHHAPTLAQVEEWINEAKSMSTPSA